MSFFERLAAKLDLDDFDKRHKTAFVILACSIIIIIVLWVLQLQKSIVNPLYGGLSLKDLQQSTNQTTQTQISTSDAELKNKDTDGDGLNDYDEINIYHTSPYLADSDGDGINDAQEIKNGTDPNCPTGKQCVTTSNAATQSSPSNSQALQSALNQSGLVPTSTNTVKQTETTSSTGTTATTGSTLTAEEKNALKTILGSSNDPATLRNFLLQNGADKNYINSLSDQDLQKVINEILK